MAGRTHGSGDHVGEGSAALFPELAHEQDGVQAGDLVDAGQVHGRADVDDQDGLLIVLRAESDLGNLLRQEHEFFRFAVGALTGLAGNDIETGVGLARSDIRFGHRAPCGVDEAGAEDVVGVGAAADLQESGPHFMEELFLLFLELRFIIVEPGTGRHGVAGVLKSLEHIDVLSRVDFPAAGAAENGLGDAGAIQGDVPRSRRKRSVVAVVPLPLVFLGRCTCVGPYFHGVCSSLHERFVTLRLYNPHQQKRRHLFGRCLLCFVRFCYAFQAATSLSSQSIHSCMPSPVRADTKKILQSGFRRWMRSSTASKSKGK